MFESLATFVDFTRPEETPEWKLSEFRVGCSDPVLSQNSHVIRRLKRNSIGLKYVWLQLISQMGEWCE
jgi:hypothetical protein